MKLTHTKLRSLDTPGRYFDGAGLYLELTQAGGKYWRMKYRFGGKEKRLAFGVYPAVSLAQAREARKRAKELLAQDIDPSTAKREERGLIAPAPAAHEVDADNAVP